jgi:predicted nucleotidyltransferase
MLNKQEILSYLAEKKAALQSEYRVTKLGLIGSFARDEQTENSDIDVLVEFAPYTEQLSEKKESIKIMLRNRFDREVDICREKYIKPYFKTQILKSAIYV